MNNQSFTDAQYTRVLDHIRRYTRGGEYPLVQSLANIAMATGYSKVSKILIRLKDEGKIRIVSSDRRKPNKIYFINDKSE